MISANHVGWAQRLYQIRSTTVLTRFGVCPMSRVASPFTVAAKNLIRAAKCNIKYPEARQLLIKQKIEVAEEPGERSSDCAKFVEAFDGYTKPANDEEFQATASEIGKTLGFSNQRLPAIVAEYWRHKAYKDEVNSFNVSKSMVKKELGITKVSASRKPALQSSKGGKNSGIVRLPARRTAVAATPTGSTEDEYEALRFVEDNGGKVAILQQIESANAEAADYKQKAEEAEAQAQDLLQKLDLVAKLHQRVSAAA